MPQQLQQTLNIVLKWSKYITVLFTYISNILENTDGCAEQYRCVNSLYLLSMLAHTYNIITDYGVGAPVHGREVIDGFNDTEKWLFSMLMTYVQLPGVSSYDTQISLHASSAYSDLCLARDLKKKFRPNTGTWIFGSRKGNKTCQ